MIAAVFTAMVLRVGMPAEEAVALLENVEPAPQNSRVCAEWHGQSGGRTYWLMAEDGLVTSFDLFGEPGGPLTAALVRLGDPAPVRTATPGLRLELSAEGRVTAIRGGKSAEGLIEGCEWTP